MVASSATSGAPAAGPGGVALSFAQAAPRLCHGGFWGGEGGGKLAARQFKGRDREPGQNLTRRDRITDIDKQGLGLKTDVDSGRDLGGGDDGETFGGSQEQGKGTSGGVPLLRNVAQAVLDGGKVVDELVGPGGVEGEPGWRGIGHHALEYTDIGRYVNGSGTVFESILETTWKVLEDRGLDRKGAKGAEEDGA